MCEHRKVDGDEMIDASNESMQEDPDAEDICQAMLKLDKLQRTYLKSKGWTYKQYKHMGFLWTKDMGEEGKAAVQDIDFAVATQISMDRSKNRET